MLGKRFTLWAVLPIACIVVASWSFSLALQGGWLRRSLSAKLTATFGRPVQVARFKFTILGGPRLEADSVTVGEDPRFGDEYFLRADRLMASLRWAALLRGRIEFGKFSLSRPSLNLVHFADGKWNVETWLPPADKRPLVSPDSPRSPLEIGEHFSRIEIDAGRINFKQGAEKLQFALVDVTGYLSQESAGRWSLDLEAHPMRAAVILQRSGTLRLRGTIGGTSARLQPADLRLSWESASVADAARLARGSDYGLRGLLDAEFTARIGRPAEGAAAGAWQIDGALRLQGIHRWNLPSRPDNPAINLKLTAAWRPGNPRLDVQQWLLEAPHSSVSGLAHIDWARPSEPDVRVLRSQIGFPDLVNWGRAFLPGVSENLEINGSVGLQATLAGWPPRIADLDVSSTGATVRDAGSKLAPILIGPVQAFWRRRSLVLAPVAVRLSSIELVQARRGVQPEVVPEGAFRIEGALGPVHPGDALRDWPYRLAISGQTSRLQDLQASAAALGWKVGHSWDVEGPANVQIVSTGSLSPGTSLIHGQLAVHDLRLTSSAINEPILVSAATLKFLPGQRRIEIGGAQALGAQWRGDLEWQAASGAWTFDLSTDWLELEALGRSLAQGRQGLLYRIFPFAGSPALGSQAESAIAGISAQGRLHIDELVLAPFRLEKIEAAAQLEQGTLTLRRAQADLYGGRVSGDFQAQLAPEPRYSFQGQVDRTDLSALAALTSLKNGFGGIGSGELALAAHGLGRQALLASLDGEGFLHVQDATIEALDEPLASMDTGFRDTAGNRFRNSTVSFRVEDGHIRVDPLLLSGRYGQLEIAGNIDFTRRLNLQVRSLPRDNRLDLASDPPSPTDVWIMGGTLDAPQIVRQERASAGNQAITRAGRR
jgi:hypothetical protein